MSMAGRNQMGTVPGETGDWPPGGLSHVSSAAQGGAAVIYRNRYR